MIGRAASGFFASCLRDVSRMYDEIADKRTGSNVGR
jgi:hypothetical protein